MLSTYCFEFSVVNSDSSYFYVIQHKFQIMFNSECKQLFEYS